MLTLQVPPLVVGAVEGITNAVFADNHLISKLATSFVGGKKRQSNLFCMETHIRMNGSVICFTEVNCSI